MVKMLGIFGKRADPFEQTPEKRERGIHDRNQQGHYRNEIINFVGVALVQGKKGDQSYEEPKGKAARITEEIYYLIPVVTLLIPIMDTTFSFFRRLFKGISPFSKDAEHFHHRLQKLGLSSSKAIWLLFGIGFYFDMTAMVPSFHITLILHFIPIYFIFVILNIIFLVYLLHRSEKKYKSRFPSERIP
jgi:hypothetical protein